MGAEEGGSKAWFFLKDFPGSEEERASRPGMSSGQI
jgi:hypothetical protein